MSSTIPSRHVEIEAKFSVPDQGLLRRLAAVRTLAGMRLSARKTMVVHDTYHDTDDGALAAAGYAWRVRTAEGQVTTTLKSLATSTGPVHRREEIEVLTDDPPEAWPQGPAKELALRLVGDKPLRPLVSLTQQRTSRILRRSSQDIAVMSLDEVTATAGERSDQYWELEIELEEGTEEDLDAVVAYLVNEWGLLPESRSKYARAMALLSQSTGLLSGGERETCRSIAARPDLHGRRARALLALDNGVTQVEASQIARMSERRVRYWLATFREQRLAVFPRRVLAGADRTANALRREPRPIVATPRAAPDQPPPATATPPPPSNTSRISPDHTMAEAAYLTLERHFERMRSHEVGTREGEDPEELHDMRVATRRMRAALLVFGDALEPDKIAHLRKGLRRTGRALGAVRDLDVFWLKTSRYLDVVPPERRDELTTLRIAWEEERSRARASLLDHLNGGRYARLVESMTDFLKTPGDAERRPFDQRGRVVPRRVRHILPAILYQRVAALLAFDEWLTGASTPLPRLHRLRISAKALRYTLEFFVEPLGPQTRDLIKALKRLQDHLGDIQDDVVAITLLRDFLTWGTWRHRDGSPPPAEPVLAPGVASYLAARQRDVTERLSEFPSLWAEFTDSSFTRHVAEAMAAMESGSTDGQG